MDGFGRVNGVVIDATDTMGLGGSAVRPCTTDYGWDYAVVADPEGNEFCLIKESEGP
jgi:predicted enzyme related to lactoylglutathione lyase